LIFSCPVNAFVSAEYVVTLILRIYPATHAKLFRQQNRGGKFMPAEVPLAIVRRFGVFELDLETGELRKAGVRLKLQKQPLQVLKLLLQRSGETVTREELRSEIWSSDVFVDFDNSLNTAVNKLRDALGDTSGSPRFIETVPRRGYRFIAAVTGNEHQPSATVDLPSRRTNWKVIVPVLALLLALPPLIWYAVRPHPPLEKGTILLGDFVNRTGDVVFDGTLRQGLSVQLEQSPWLRVLPEEQIHDTLRMMGRAANVALTPDVAREVCQRNDAAVALDASIALIGARYDLVLRAVDCVNGDLLASAEAQAQDKNHVLDAVSKLASDMRGKLGESLSSVRRYNIPLASATTPSLEALRCYTQGVQVLSKNSDYTESLSWFQKAIELDPNFAMAYWAIGDIYGILGETNSAKDYNQKAFELREHVSEREKGLIEADYYYYVLGDVEKARRSSELLSKLYPYSEAHNSVAVFAETVGQYDVGLTEYLEALRLAPRRSFLYRDLAYTYLVLDRIEDASAVVQRAHGLDLDANLAPVLYSIAFYRSDRSEMARQAATVAGKPGIEDLVLALDADTAAYFGQLGKARALSHRAAESAKRVGEKEISAEYYAASAIRDALFGEASKAKQQATIARRYSGGRDLAYGIALSLTYSGEIKQAQALTDEMAEKFPDDTVLKCNYLPTLRARLALMHLNAPQALDELAGSVPCELGLPVYSYYNWPNLYPVYVRGEAYLGAHRGAEAVAEFQKILAHRGVVLNEPIGALAHLQLGRAYRMSGDSARARAAYQRFLSLWQDADPDIPILQQAKAEYASLTGQ
jgi:DNA-binding winged helix-turn-helix (wHTH) protein/tetratricopeptide (TPR) repeat protein